LFQGSSACMSSHVIMGQGQVPLPLQTYRRDHVTWQQKRVCHALTASWMANWDFNWLSKLCYSSLVGEQHIPQLDLGFHHFLAPRQGCYKPRSRDSIAAFKETFIFGGAGSSRLLVQTMSWQTACVTGSHWCITRHWPSRPLGRRFRSDWELRGHRLLREMEASGISSRRPGARKSPIPSSVAMRSDSVRIYARPLAPDHIQCDIRINCYAAA